MLALPTTIDGAMRGSAALLFGFVIEAVAVWWGIRGLPFARRSPVGELPSAQR
jgi:hypothetical protein